MELLSVARMREIERAAMSGGAVTGLHLMERAAAGLAAAAAPEPGMPIAVCAGRATMAATAMPRRACWPRAAHRSPCMR